MTREFKFDSGKSKNRRDLLKKIGATSISAPILTTVATTPVAAATQDGRGKKGEKRGAAYFPPKGKSKPTFTHPWKHGPKNSKRNHHARPTYPEDSTDDEGEAEPHPRRVDRNGRVYK